MKQRERRRSTEPGLRIKLWCDKKWSSPRLRATALLGPPEAEVKHPWWFRTRQFILDQSRCGVKRIQSLVTISCSAGVSPAVAWASCPRPLAPRLVLRWTSFQGRAKLPACGSGRSRHGGRDAPATTLSPDSQGKPKAFHFYFAHPPLALRVAEACTLLYNKGS